MSHPPTDPVPPAVSGQGPALLRQIAGFAGVGVVAAILHYGVLVMLVEGFRIGPVPATLAGYLAGGAASYGLSRTHAFRSSRPHVEAGWRFIVVAGVGFVLTGLVMDVLTARWNMTYLPAQLLTTGIVLVWSFAAHRWWTFR